VKVLLTICVLWLAPVLTAQSKYSNSTYGISLRYPKDYELKEGKLAKNDRGLGYLGPIPMEFVAPGGVRVVTIEAPPNSYPGTDFVNAFFTVSVNRYLTKDECREFPVHLLSGPRFAGETKSSRIALTSAPSTRFSPDTDPQPAVV
jgi:hypothetical protein